MRGFFAVLAVLVAAGIGLAYYQGWFNLTVNQEKINEDTAATKETLHGLGKQVELKTEEAAEKVKEKTKKKNSTTNTATGKINKVEAADNRFVMATDENKMLTIYLNPSSKLRNRDQDVKLEELQVDDSVKVDYDVEDGKNMATSVVVKR